MTGAGPSSAPIRAAVLTVSSSRTLAEDASGDALAGLVDSLGGQLLARDLVADDRAAIAKRLRDWADGNDRCDLILTSGGTGFAPDDVTPEATADVLEREAPGIAEAMRRASAAHTANWMLSRARAGTRGATLIVNFPGSPRAIAETGAALAAALPHAVALLRGERPGHG